MQKHATSAFSGNNLFINFPRCTVKGDDCTVAGDYCTVKGNRCTVSGVGCIVVGNNCKVTGDCCIVSGNYRQWRQLQGPRRCVHRYGTRPRCAPRPHLAQRQQRRTGERMPRLCGGPQANGDWGNLEKKQKVAQHLLGQWVTQVGAVAFIANARRRRG